jgi:hypothetical protein
VRSGHLMLNRDCSAPGKTGMKQRRKKPHEKGLAIHLAPSFALGIARCAAKRRIADSA